MVKPKPSSYEDLIAALQYADRQGWPMLAALLADFDRAEDWRPFANSMSAFLKKAAPVVGLSFRMLGRYWQIGRFYNAEVLPTLALSGSYVPRLQDIPADISAQSFEILAKIRNLAGDDGGHYLVRDILERRIKRDELWKLYTKMRDEARRSPDPKGLHPAGEKTPLEDDTFFAIHEFNKVLRANQSAFLDKEAPRTAVFEKSDLKNFIKPTDIELYPLDFIVTEQLNGSPHVRLHGIVVAAGNYGALTALFDSAREWVDRVWLAVPDVDAELFTLDMLPYPWIGQISFGRDSLRIIRAAASAENLGGRATDLIRYFFRLHLEFIANN